MAVQPGFRDSGEHSLYQPVAKRGNTGRVFGQLGGGQRKGLAHAHNAGHVFRSCPKPPFLRAALDEIVDARPFADVQRAHALGAVKLVAGEGKQICVPVVYVDGNGPGGLHCVGVEQHARLPGDLTDLSNGFQRADLVIGGHDGNQGRVVRQRPANVVRGNQTVFVHRQIGDAKAVPFQRAAAVQHCVMLDGGGNDVLFSRLCCSAADGPVVTFTAPGGEVNFPGLGMKRRGHLSPGVLHRLVGLSPSCVNGAGIARPVAEEGQHFGKDFRPDRCGGGVVQINKGTHEQNLDSDGKPDENRQLRPL